MCSLTSLRVIRKSLEDGNYNFNEHIVELDMDKMYHMPRNMALPKWVIDVIDDRTVKLYVRNKEATSLCEVFTMTDGKSVTSLDGFFVSRLLEQRVRRYLTINMTIFELVRAGDTKYKKPLVGYVRKEKQPFNIEAMIHGRYNDHNI